jgi:signal peptidase I
VANGYPKPQLITDFAGYNTEKGSPPLPFNPTRYGLHWVGDLVLECTLRVESKEGQFLMALVQGGRIFHCSLDVASGKATLFVDGARPLETVQETSVRGPGTYDLRFANVDAQLVLWVSGRVVQFDPKPEYDPRVEQAQVDVAGPSSVGPDPVPNEEDLRPVRIGSRGLAATVSHVRLFRDVYYIATRSTGSPTDYETPENHPLRNPTSKVVAAVFSDPRQWSFLRSRREVSFTLQADEFLMLGDNSAESKDSRLWDSDYATPYFVRRELLKGKAVCIYWPHSWDRLPGSDKIPWFPNGIWFPLFPNFSRMAFVR